MRIVIVDYLQVGRIHVKGELRYLLQYLPLLRAIYKGRPILRVVF